MITVVCGPPAAGKTTYVRKHAEPGDLIVDWDDLLAVLSGAPVYVRHDHLRLYANVARKAVERVLLKRHRAERSAAVAVHGDVPNAWIIRSAPSRAERDEYRITMDANIVILETPERVCIDRIHADPRRADIKADQIDAVRQWWFDYVPDADPDASLVVTDA